MIKKLHPACPLSTLHVHRRLMVVVISVVYDVEKSYVNAGIPEKSWFCIGIFTGSQLFQSGIGILASAPVWYHWSGISPALPSFDYTLLVCIFFLLFLYEPIPESLFSQYRWNSFHRVAIVGRDCSIRMAKNPWLIESLFYEGIYYGLLLILYV